MILARFNKVPLSLSPPHVVSLSLSSMLVVVFEFLLGFLFIA